MISTPMDLNHKLSRIRAVVCDIDGVITDGSILVSGSTSEDLLRVVNAKDAFGLRVAGLKGLITGIISGGETDALLSRCKTMGINEENIHLGCRGKLAVFQSFCTRNGLQADEVAYFGDDIPDTQVLAACGCGFAPADAVEEAKAAADYVCTRGGGRGCIREGVEMILKAQNKWQFDPDKFDTIF